MAPHKRGAQEQNAILIFMDESGFSLRPSVRRTWARRGQTPTLVHRFNWKRLNAIGAILCTPKGDWPQLFLHLQKETVKEDDIVWFLQVLERAVHRMDPVQKVVLVWDGLPAHKSVFVKEHLAQQTEWLTVEPLPGYAPELNPVEYVWSPVKGKHTANFCPDTIHELEEHLNRTQSELEADQAFLTSCLLASPLYTKKT